MGSQQSAKSINSSKSSKTTTRVGKFAIIGAILALFNFAIYTFLARIVFNTNELLWLVSIISYALATILAYFLHSNITWKERHITKRGILMFFLWNGLTAIIISPLFTWLFGFITPLYQFAHHICEAIHIPFDYNFVESTGIFCLTTAVTMILNYFFYDRLVFGVTPVHYPPLTDTKAKVSLIVPIYNVSKYLQDCLDSIANQSYDNLEVILIDDGSTDDSAKIAKSFTKKDSRFKYYHQANHGQSSARNLGLTKATGDYLGFIDADDKVAKSFVADLLTPLISDDATTLSICGIHYKRLREHTAKDTYVNPLRPRHHKESLQVYVLYLLAVDGRLYSSVNKLYHREVATKCRFDESLNFAEDTKFVLDYLAKSPQSHNGLAFVLKPLYIYNFGTETSTMHTVASSWDNWQTSYRNLQSWLGPRPSVKERFWLHTVHLRWRISHYRSKRRAKQ